MKMFYLILFTLAISCIFWYNNIGAERISALSLQWWFWRGYLALSSKHIMSINSSIEFSLSCSWTGFILVRMLCIGMATMYEICKSDRCSAGLCRSAYHTKVISVSPEGKRECKNTSRFVETSFFGGKMTTKLTFQQNPT